MTEHPETYDVAILGGGLAGLTLALDLKRALPDLSIVVMERMTLPYPESAHKIGESTVELGSHYLSGLIGREYLERCQVRKSGIRMYFSAGDNSEISRRPEFGTNDFLPIHTYQVDRGILENELWARAEALGVTCRTGCKLERCERDGERHRITFSDTGGESAITARWMVDATGRAGFLKQQLDLAAPADHTPNAAWFRIAAKLDVEDLTADEQWRRRLRPDFRWRATNHLVGPGYWVWIIPLVTGSTSIGIVASPEFVPFADIRSFEKSLAWLRAHEPACARFVDEHRDRIQDFAAIRHYAHGARRVYSAERWALTGEAGVFVDPFLSPGTDFIAMANAMIVEMIRRDLAGEPIEEYVEFMNGLFLNLFNLVLGWFRHLYGVFHKDQAMMLWIGWYFLLYISFPVTLNRYRHIADLEFMKSVGPQLQRFGALSLAGIKLLTDFAARYERAPTAEFIDIFKLRHVIDMQRSLVAAETMTDAEVRALLDRHLGMIEATVVEYHRLLADGSAGGEIDPYVLAGAPEAVPPGVRRGYADPQIAGNIRGLWFQD